MNFHKTLAVLAAVAALSAPAFAASTSPTLLTLKGLAAGDDFGLPNQEPASGWKDLVMKVAKNGTFTPGNAEIPSTLGLARIQGPEDATHRADYINIWGMVDESGTFIAVFATLVSEQWTLNGDKWTIDQWLHIIDMSGAAQRANKVLLVEDRGGRVLDHQSKQMDVQSPEASQSRNSLLDMWKKYQPEPRKKQ